MQSCIVRVKPHTLARPPMPQPKKLRVAYMLPASIDADVRALAYALGTTHSAVVAQSVAAFVAALPPTDRAKLRAAKHVHAA